MDVCIIMRMARINVYLPDDLADELAEVDGLNVSAVCQRALREELSIMQTIEQSTENMERIEVDVWDPNSGPMRKVAFTGRWLVEPSEDEAIGGCVYGVALTARGRIAVWSENDKYGAGLDHFDDVEEMEDFERGVYPKVLVADVRAALSGTTAVLELDI